MSDEIEVPDYIPPFLTLPLVGTYKKCPACGSKTVTAIDADGEMFGTISQAEFEVEFHRYGVLGAPCGERFQYDELKTLGPHLCKICAVCRYGWSESVNTNGS